MWLLHVGDHPRRQGAARPRRSPERRRHHGGARAAPLPLRLPPAGDPRRPSRGRHVSTLPGSLAENPEIDLSIRIDPGGTVTLFTGKVELGQGLRTAIGRIGAEQLNVSLDRIRVQTADTAHGPKEGLTAGSMS